MAPSTRTEFSQLWTITVGAVIGWSEHNFVVDRQHAWRNVWLNAPFLFNNCNKEVWSEFTVHQQILSLTLSFRFQSLFFIFLLLKSSHKKIDHWRLKNLVSEERKIDVRRWHCNVFLIMILGQEPPDCNRCIINKWTTNSGILLWYHLFAECSYTKKKKKKKSYFFSSVKTQIKLRTWIRIRGVISSVLATSLVLWLEK